MGIEEDTEVDRSITIVFISRMMSKLLSELSNLQKKEKHLEKARIIKQDIARMSQTYAELSIPEFNHEDYLIFLHRHTEVLSRIDRKSSYSKLRPFIDNICMLLERQVKKSPLL